MNLTKIIILMSLWISFLAQQAIAQNSSMLQSESTLFDIQFIMSNEVFTLQKVEQEEGDENVIHSCIFESPSALWVIRYCGEMEKNLETPWYLFLAGSFLLKDTDRRLEYYLKRESHIYRNIEHGSLAFTRNLSLMRVHVIDGDSQVDIGWPRRRLPFLQTLARVQEQYIEQSAEQQPANNLTEQAAEQVMVQLENLQKQEQMRKKISDDKVSAIRNIMENEDFTFDRVYYDGFQDNIRNCVFESPSAVWVIKYCEDIEDKLLDGGNWWSLLAGHFSVRNTAIQMDYYVEIKGRRNIYTSVEQDGPSFVKHLSVLRRLTFIEGSSKENMDLFQSENFPFLQTLARVQDQFIEQSVKESILTQVESAF